MANWIFSSSLLTAFVIGLRFLLKGKISLRLQYAMWALVLLRLLIPVSFGSTKVSVENFAPPQLSVLQPLPQQPLISPEIPPEPVQIPVQTAKSLDIHDILATIWIAGMAVVGMILVGCNVHFGWKLMHSRQKLPFQAQRLPIYLSSAIDTPCLFGLLRPTIYITEQTTGLSLRHSVAHELTHFYHGDLLWSLLRGVCVAVHWYNPLVWWAAILSKEDAELACDEATIARLGETERAAYGRTVLQMTCKNRQNILLSATTMGGNVKERIFMLAKKPKTAIYTLLLILLLSAAAVGCTFTGAMEEYTEPSTTITADESVPEENDAKAEAIEALARLCGKTTNSLVFRLGEPNYYALPFPSDFGISYKDYIRSVFQLYEWEKLENPAVQGESWISLNSPDTNCTMTFWDADGVSILQSTQNNDITYWQAVPTDAYDESLTKKVRQVFYKAQNNSLQLYAFDLDNNPEAAAEQFVSVSYGDFLKSLAPGSAHRALTYEVSTFKVLEVNEAATAVCGKFCYAITPDCDNPSVLLDDNTWVRDGKYYTSLGFVLEKTTEGKWQCYQIGADVLGIPEELQS